MPKKPIQTNEPGCLALGRRGPYSTSVLKGAQKLGQCFCKSSTTLSSVLPNWVNSRARWAAPVTFERGQCEAKTSLAHSDGNHWLIKCLYNFKQDASFFSNGIGFKHRYCHRPFTIRNTNVQVLLLHELQDSFSQFELHIHTRDLSNRWLISSQLLTKVSLTRKKGKTHLNCPSFQPQTEHQLSFEFLHVLKRLAGKQKNTLFQLHR